VLAAADATGGNTLCNSTASTCQTPRSSLVPLMRPPFTARSTVLLLTPHAASPAVAYLVASSGIRLSRRAGQGWRQLVSE
jgi:hypothetical protein